MLINDALGMISVLRICRGFIDNRVRATGVLIWIALWKHVAIYPQTSPHPFRLSSVCTKQEINVNSHFPPLEILSSRSRVPLNTGGKLNLSPCRWFYRSTHNDLLFVLIADYSHYTSLNAVRCSAPSMAFFCVRTRRAPSQKGRQAICSGFDIIMLSRFIVESRLGRTTQPETSSAWQRPLPSRRKMKYCKVCMDSPFLSLVPDSARVFFEKFFPTTIKNNRQPSPTGKKTFAWEPLENERKKSSTAHAPEISF